MFVIRGKERRQAGDTIVEVLIVLAVLGLALGISFVTANRSLQGARQAQEHSEALEYAQAQLEDLRVLAPSSATTSKNIFGQSADFCVLDPTIATPLVTANPSSSADPCLTAGLYHRDVAFDTASSTFTITITWDDIRGQGKDNVSMVYRLHQ